MARSKAFEALLNEAGKTVKKSKETLKQVVPFDQPDKASDKKPGKPAGKPPKQPDGQSNKQAKKQTVGHPIGQTVEQTDSRTDRQALKQSVRRSSRHSDGQTVKHTSRQTVGHPGEHSGRQSFGRSSRHSDRQTVEHTDRHSDGHDFQNPFHWMTEKQAAVLSFLVNNESHITRLDRISEATGIPYGTVRGSINKLVKEKCISKPSRYRRGNAQGVTYNVNEDLCAQFKTHHMYRHTVGHSLGQTVEQTTGQSNRHSLGQTIKQTDSQALSQTDKQTVPYNSSSSSFIKETTTCGPSGVDPIEIDSTIERHPELGYWREKSLTAKQVMSWMKTADCTLNMMVEYLCYCRFEMVDLKKEKNIDNVFNYFFKILERSGSYPKPKEYKSYKEKQIEAERKRSEELKKQSEELMEAYREKWQQERNVEFWQMMNDPDGELYKRVYAKLSNFDKKRGHRGGKAFESAMRRRFDEVVEGE